MTTREKLVSESDIQLCQCCGSEIDIGYIFCDVHDTPINKQIYEFFSDFPSDPKTGILIRPRGEKLYNLFAMYLAAKFDAIQERRFILKSISGSGKSILMDMIAYIELTHFPNSLTVIGSVSDKVSKQHIERLRYWLSLSVFGRYISGSRDATASKSEIKLAKLNSKVIGLPQSASTVTGWHPSLLIIDEVGRMKQSSFYGSFFQMGKTSGAIEMSASTPYLDSIAMQEIWNTENMVRTAFEPEDCWWLGREFWKDIENSNMPEELKEQLYGAKFRSVSNRVIPDDFLLQSISNKHLQTTPNLIMGVDFGKQQDPTAVVVLDVLTGDVKYAHAFELKEDWHIQFAKIRDIYKKFNPMRIIADASNIGEVIITANLSDLNIEPVSMQGGPNKREVINKLRLAFLHKKVNIVEKEFLDLINQISLYIYTDPDHLKSGPISRRTHDDLVDALALAIRGMDVSSEGLPFDDSIWELASGEGGSLYFDEDGNGDDIWAV